MTHGIGRAGLVGMAALALALGTGTALAKDMKGHAHGGMKHGAMKSAAGKVGKLVVERVWARASVSKNGAAYVTIRNEGGAMDKLVAASSPVAAKVELHTHTMDKGVMRMREIAAVEVHPGAPAVLRPGGNHIMLIGLKRKLVKGESFPLTLKFAKAGEVTVTVPIRSIAAKGQDHKHGDHKHGDHKHGDHKHTN